MTHIFISYSRADGNDHASWLEAKLIANGFEVWRDMRDIDPSRDFTGEIEDGIDRSHWVIICITPDVQRPESFVRREIAYALVKQKPVIVARFANVSPPITIINHTWIDFFVDAEASFEQLIALIISRHFADATFTLEKKPPNFFISYRRDDAAHVTGRIYDRLTSQYGRDMIFKDVDNMPLGVDFKQYLDNEMRQCTALLVIIGDKWLNITDRSGRRRLDDPRDFVRIEIEAGLKRNIPVIPLLIDDTIMPDEDDLPESLRRLVYRNGISIRPDPDFHRDMDRLINHLDQLINK